MTINVEESEFKTFLNMLKEAGITTLKLEVCQNIPNECTMAYIIMAPKPAYGLLLQKPEATK